MFVRHVSTALLVALAALHGSCRSAATTSAAARPNLVLIVADDLGWGELGSYGQEKIRTPHLDRLAAQGMRWTQFYSGAPVCAPSREVLLTGRHTGHATIRGNLPAKKNGERVEGQHPIPAETLTIAEVLRDAGYATGAMGKWGLGPVGSSGDPNAQGFDRFFGYNCQRVAHSYYPPHVWADAERIEINPDPIPGHQRQPEGEVTMERWFDQKYAPDLIVEDALRFLGEHQDEPFFLYLPFVEPHVAMQPPREHVEAYPEEWDERVYRGQCGYLPHPRPRAGYAAMISDLDEHVGRILGALEELGLADDTLVVFTSDNGTTHTSGGDPLFGVGGVDAAFFDSTAGLRGFKGSVYEGGIRVPLIARWPGRIDAGTSTNEPAYFPDLFPTLCSAAGVTPEVPAELDGVDLLPTLLSGTPPAAREAMVWVFPEYGAQLAVRFGRWKLVRQNLARPKRDSGWELYDIESDPAETLDLAAEKPELVARGVEILTREADDNPLFPVPVPGV